MALLPHCLLPKHNIFAEHQLPEQKANRYFAYTRNTKNAAKNEIPTKLPQSNCIWLKIPRGHRSNPLPSISTRSKNNRSDKTCKSSNKIGKKYYYDKMGTDVCGDKHSRPQTRFGITIPRGQMAESNDK
eukprot:14453353-Ditylum_brightwellii.AAC.1